VNAIEYYAHHIAYAFIVLLCALPLVVGAQVLAPLLPAGPVEVAANLVGLLLLFIFIVGGSWLVNTASRKRVIEGEGFFEALGSAWGEGRLYLSFLPVAGSLFRGKSAASKRGEPPGPIRPR
jgi:hypothetical protein